MAAFDRLSDNVAVVRGNGELDFANAGARRLLALGDGLAVVGPRLRAVDAATTAALRGAIAKAASGHGPDDVTIDCRRPSGCPSYRVTVRAIDTDSHGTQAGAGGRVLLLIGQAGRRRLGWICDPSRGPTR